MQTLKMLSKHQEKKLGKDNATKKKKADTSDSKKPAKKGKKGRQEFSLLNLKTNI